MLGRVRCVSFCARGMPLPTGTTHITLKIVLFEYHLVVVLADVWQIKDWFRQEQIRRLRVDLLRSRSQLRKIDGRKSAVDVP